VSIHHRYAQKKPAVERAFHSRHPTGLFPVIRIVFLPQAIYIFKYAANAWKIAQPCNHFYLKERIMKNSFLSLATSGVIFLSASVFSQVNYRPGVSVGLSIYNEKVTASGTARSADPKTGVSVGAVFEIVMKNWVSIEPGIVYSQRGSRIDFGGGVMGNDNLSYLTIPVNAKLKIPATPAICPYVLAGLNGGILMSATADSSDQSTDAKDAYNSIDFGLDFGAGFELDLANIVPSWAKIVPSIEYVYYVGLANTWKDAPDGVSAKNHGSEIKAGLKYKW
jgi:opacity protein-like surface antigen